MPFSYAQYPGNGSTITFTVPFPYLLRAHVKLYYGLSLQSGGYTQLLVDGVNYSWTSATQVQLTAAPVVGQTLSIRRETPTTSRLVDWNDGSALTADALDTADLQNFYAIQEHKDYIEALSINPNTNVTDGSITANKLSSDAVTTIKIQDQAVTTGKIADGAILDADVNGNAGIASSKLSFTPAGTGAATRTVEGKLRDVVSVKDFGAVADGDFATGAGTNNSAAFQSAINSLTSPLNGGKALYIPAGVYKLASQITIPSGVSVVGDGPWNSIVFCPNAFANTGGLIRLNGAGGPPTSVSGLGILAQTGGASGYGLVSVANGVLLDWLWVNGFAVGIQLSQTDNFLTNFASELNTTNLYITETDVNVSNGTVYGGTNGVTVANSSSVGNGRVHLVGVRATTCTQNGFYLGPAKYVDVTGCSASHVNNGAFSASGITVNTSTDVSIVGFNGSLGTTSTTSTGIKIVASTRVSVNGGQVRGFLDGVSASASGDVSINAVQATANGRSGVYLNGGTRITVSGCTARSNGTAGVNDYGIFSGNTDADSTHTLIGNTCTDVSGGVQSYGISATVGSATSYSIIDGNLCQNNGTADILLDGVASRNVKLGKANIAGTISDVTAPAIAAAATLVLPLGADVVIVTGTTGVTSISATGNARRTVTLIFAAALTVTDGSNLKLAGNFTTTADDTLTLYCDGANWIEIARSVN